MKKVPCFLLVFLLAVQAGISQKAVTLDDCFTFFKFYPQTAGSFRFTPDGHHYLEAEEGAIVEYDLGTGMKSRTVAEKSELSAAGEWDEFAFSADQSKVLLRGNTKPVYRHSVLADYWVFDLKTRKATRLHDAPVQFAAFSADGGRVAFVSDNNLYYKDLAAEKTVQVTSDGEKNAIINGLPDWVYEEEFSPVEGDGMVATAWSPDGKRLAFIRFDERAVPQYPLTWYNNGLYPRYTEFKYPKVGSPNSRVSVQVYDLATGKTAQALPGTEEQDIYLPRLYWTPDNQLCIYLLNREQNDLSLVLYDPAAENTGMLLTEMDPAYVDMEVCDNLTFLPGNRQFLWMSERDGYAHLYLLPRHPAAAPPPVQLTKGNYDVTKFYGLDPARGKFYYQTATPTPMDRQVWEGALDTSVPHRLLTPGPGMHEATFSPSFDFYVHQWSDINTPPMAQLRTRDGDALRPLVNNDRVTRTRQQYGFAPIEFITLKAADSTDLNAWILKPRDFDPAKKYPVLFDIYGGPGSQTVKNEYNGYTGPWHQMLAQKGYIIVSVDNRGTGARGRAFKKCTQLQLGKYETLDQIAAARQLGALPYVDPNRIGIWGWSFGGYLSSSCVLKGADVFKMAMAVAPVTNWKWYDTAYTERFMRTTKDNPAGYEENSPINFADRLRGGNYLICHGVADDNVHWQQTVEMVNALIKANKQFETYYYPNRNHGIYGENATKHLFTKLTNFVVGKL